MIEEYGSNYQIIEDDLDYQLLIQLKLKSDSRLKFTGAATNFLDGIGLPRIGQSQILILDHFIDGQIMGLEAAPLIKADYPAIKILLFTSHNLAIEARREPAIDAYLQKRDMNKLLLTVQQLLNMETLAK